MFAGLWRALFSGRSGSRWTPRQNRRAWVVEGLEERLVPAAVWPTQFFSPYVNTLLDTSYDFAAAAQNGGFKYLTMGFITADAQGKPSWDGQYELGSDVDNQLRAQVANLRALGGDVMISFGGDTEGGGSGQELAVALTDVSQIQAAYQQVIDSYGLTHVDFDVEGSNMMNNPASIDRRSQAIAGLEQAANAAGRELDVYLTLPSSSQGLMTDWGLQVLDSALKYGVQLAGVNLMTMDYSDGTNYDGVNGPTMGDAAISAAQGLFGQLKTELAQYGIAKTDAQVWQMIDITPQIGVNASSAGTEVFTLADAQQVETFAQQQGLGRLAFWAIGRDQNPNNQTDLSESYSGVTQQPFDFSHIFDQFGGNAQVAGVPNAPTGVSATASDGQVVVNWTPVDGATSYNVYRGTDSGGEQWLTNVTTPSFTDTGVTDGTTYFYTITAGTDAGESAWSSEVSGTPQATPPAPSGLVATPGNGRVVAVTWTPVPGATSYNVYRGTASGGEQWLTNVTAASFTDTGVTGGTTYYYTVTAGNDSGESAWSTEVTATVANTTTRLSVNRTRAAYGQPVVLVATVRPTAFGLGRPQGTVSFLLGNTVLGTEGVNVLNRAVLVTTALPVGTNSIQAVYNPSGALMASTADPITVTVTAAPTVLRLTTSTHLATVAQTVHFAATVFTPFAAAGVPQGQVTFYLDGQVLATVQVQPGTRFGVAGLDVSLPVGRHTITAVYSDTVDTNFRDSTAAPIGVLVS